MNYALLAAPAIKTPFKRGIKDWWSQFGSILMQNYYFFYCFKDRMLISFFKDLLKMLPEGELRLKEVVACCDVVMKVINGGGQAKIREEVLSLTNDIEHRNSAIQEKSLQLSKSRVLGILML